MATTKPEEISTCQYPFKDWEQVFKDYKEWSEVWGAENMQLVISTHHYSQGYWIEKRGVKVNESTDFVYVDDEVWQLEERVRKGISEKGKFHNGIII